MNSGNQSLWVLLVILAVITAIILWKRKSAKPSKGEEKKEMLQSMRDCTAELSLCRRIDKFNLKWDALVNWILAEGMDPEAKEFNLTPARRDELSKIVYRAEVEDRIRRAANNLHLCLSAFAEAIREAQGAHHNPLDVGATPGLMAALRAWENAQQEG